ncbi:MAG: O-antigen ligase family protein, partial [Pirellulaceae bacterium]
LAVLWMAFLGVVQFLGGNGKFLWIYEHPSRDTWGKVIGTFQNQNHFAHFLALGIGPLIVWMRRRHGEDRQKSFHVVPGKRRPAPWPLASSLLAVGFGLTWAAAILTFSRGGALCLGIAAATCVTMLVLKRMLGWRSLCAAGGLGLVLFVALAIYGSDRLSSRLETLASGSLQVASQSRLNLWKAQWKAIPQFAWLGSGVGSHRVVYPIYMEEHHDVDFGYGENGYFQLLLETGVVGLTLVLTGFALGMRWAFGPWFRAQCDARLVMLSAAIVPGLIASLLHSAGDFVWYIPACASVTVFLLASACRVGQLSRLPVELRSSLANGTTRPRAGWMQSASHLPALGCMTLALLVGLFAVQFQLPGAWASPHWNRYLRLARAESSELAPLAGGDTDELARVGQLLELVVHRDPWNPRARLALASVKLRQFDAQQQISENPLVLSQIRDAALASAFPTRQQQDAWLDVAIGDNRRNLDAALEHARAAIRLSPLQGLGYVFLAELSFLETPRPQAKLELIRQAVRVRPYDGRVLYAMGQESALYGDLATAIQYWRHAFRREDEVKQLIIDGLAPQLPVELFLGAFDPDLSGLRMLFAYYCRLSLEAQAKAVTPRYVTALQRSIQEEPALAASRWHELQQVHAFLGDLPLALKCQREAVALSPQNSEMRKRLAQLLSQSEQYEEAVSHLEWCLRRSPYDRELLNQLADAKLSVSHTSSRREATAARPVPRSDY